MNLTTFLGGSAAISAVIMGWGYVRAIWTKVYSLFLDRIHLEGQAADAWWTYVWMSGKIKYNHRFAPQSYWFRNLFVRPLGRRSMVAYRRVPKRPTLMWRGWVPVLVALSPLEGQDRADIRDIHLTFIRGTIDREKFILEMAAFFEGYCERNEGNADDPRYRIIRATGTLGARMMMGGDQSEPAIGSQVAESTPGSDAIPLKWKHSDIGPPANKLACDTLALTAAAQEAVQEAERWAKSREWFKERSLPWKRGWLLHGPPGTGKTSLVRAMGQDLDFPIIVLELSTFTDRDMAEAWRSKVNCWAPCIVLIEDIDTIFKGRKNVVTEGRQETGLNFGTLLNYIDGVEETEGVFLIVTTNDLGALDPALGQIGENGISTRPGRIDRVVEMAAPDENGRRKIAQRILMGYESHIEEVVWDGKHDTGAQFQERCRLRAYELWTADQENL